MTVYLVLREDQNDHGFVDTSVVGVFQQKEDALECLREEADSERQNGARVDFEGATPTAEWDVALKIEEHELT